MRVLPFALIAFLFTSSIAFAQPLRVVVLELDGDQNNKLRNQIEATMQKAGSVEVVGLDEFRSAAAKKKLNGAAAMTVIGIKRVGKQLKLDAAVAGEVGEKFKVLIYDRNGNELWTKELSIKRGMLTDDFAQKLNRAITAAAEQGAVKNAEAGNSGGGDDDGSGAGSGSGSGSGGGGDVEIDLTGDSRPVTTRTPSGRTIVTPGTGSGSSSGSGSDDRDTDLDLEHLRRSKRVGPRIISFSIAGATTWRSQCLRPGSEALKSCADFDRLPEAQQPSGTTVTFTPQVPYLGFNLAAELFPLAMLESRFINGLGLVGSFGYGSSVTTINEQNPQGQTEEKQVASSDLGWVIQAAYRVHFAMGAGEPQGIGYVGLRGGFQSRNFNIDPTAGVPLPSSQRAPLGIGFGVIGLDVALPIVRFFRLELGGSIFFSPKPSEEQIVGFGNVADDTGGVLSSGFGLDVGASGDIVALGPVMLGWTLKFRYQSYFDRYYGQGQKWTVCNMEQCGGLGEESYSTITWGASLSY